MRVIGKDRQRMNDVVVFPRRDLEAPGDGACLQSGEADGFVTERLLRRETVGAIVRGVGNGARRLNFGRGTETQQVVDANGL